MGFRYKINNVKKLIWYKWFANKKKFKCINNNMDVDWQVCKDIIKKYNYIDYYSVEKINIVETFNELDKVYKWVGGVYFNDKLFAVPTNSKHILCVDMINDKLELIGDFTKNSFKWTGGCIYNDKLYGFSRIENRILVYDLVNGVCDLEFQLIKKYDKEHHYGGVCTNEGVIYQPPRNTNSILKININTKISEEIIISKGLNFRYCGSIIHPNGYIYMFPESKGRVMVLDPRTDEIFFIGNIVTTMVFGACIAHDDNIYGFSAYGTGIMKITILENRVEMLFKKIHFGCYGSILALNGNIIGIPGDGNCIYQFDVQKQSVNIIKKIDEIDNAKCAGACISSQGNVYCVPAYGDYIYVIKPNLKINIPNDIIKLNYFNNCY